MRIVYLRPFQGLKAYMEKIIIGNWKMYKTSREGSDFLEKIAPRLKNLEKKVYLAVPFTAIEPLSKEAMDTSISIGAQNMNDAKEGAFTGEIAALMLKEAGALFVLLGHSERRQYFNETDQALQKKVQRALKSDLQPILCVGESLEERDGSRTEEVLKRQIETALEGLSKEAVGALILAYEPVWAIGTGKAATSEMIEKAHLICRETLEGLFGKASAKKIPILYGGSVKAQNTREITSCKNVDGVLVGGASLDPDTFTEIILEA